MTFYYTGKDIWITTVLELIEVNLPKYFFASGKQLEDQVAAQEKNVIIRTPGKCPAAVGI